MLRPADLLRMQADRDQIIGDNSATITIRRGSATLPAQVVRVERSGGARGRKVERPSSEESRGQITVFGTLALDIQKDDRFNYQSQLYRVQFVRPNTQQGIQAEAELIE